MNPSTLYRPFKRPEEKLAYEAKTNLCEADWAKFVERAKAARKSPAAYLRKLIHDDEKRFAQNGSRSRT